MLGRRNSIDEEQTCIDKMKKELITQILGRITVGDNKGSYVISNNNSFSFGETGNHINKIVCYKSVWSILATSDLEIHSA